MYIWQQSEWPRLHWDEQALVSKLLRVARAQGQLRGMMEGLGFRHQDQTLLLTLTQEVIQSSDIENEYLPAAEVRSSIARRLDLKHVENLVPSTAKVDAVVHITADAVINCRQPLDAKRLFDWHRSFFSSHPHGRADLRVGAYREGPMQVISGPMGRERVHYKAPPPDKVADEMQTFLRSFHASNHHENHDPVLRAGLAHFWFVTIHPFDDGNGRLARAIADLALARAEEGAPLYYSMSKQIRAERQRYYEQLETSQRNNCDITSWQLWFLECLHRSIEDAQVTVRAVLESARFWRNYAQHTFNPRQIKMLTMLLEGFQGPLSSSRWAKITKCSQDTALRDINSLIDCGALQKEPGGGRSTTYRLSSLSPKEVS